MMGEDIPLRAELEEQLRFEALLADLSAKFINVPSDEIDRQIEDAQRLVCEAFGLDVSSLWQWQPDNPVMHTLTHYYRPLGGPPVPRTMKGQDYFPWCQQRVLNREIITISSLADFPVEAVRDREVFSHFGLKTTLTIPLSVGGGPVFGSVNFNDMQRERRWSKSLIQRLQLVAQIFAHALARKVADQSLRESEARLSLAADAAEMGLWSLNLATNSLWVTDKTRELFKIPSGEDIPFEQFLSLVHPDDQSLVRETIRKTVQPPSEGQVQYRTVWPDGRVRWMLSRGRVRCDISGKPEYLMGVTVDITERKQAELALAETQLRYRLLFEAIPESVLLIGTDGCVVEANPASARLYGYESAKQLEGFYTPLLIAERDRARATRTQATVIQGKEQPSRRYTEVRRDGTEFIADVSSSTIRGPRQEVLGYIGITHDVTAFVTTEAALHKSLERFRQVAEIAREFIWEVDANGLYTYASPLVERILGYTPEELVGKKHFYDLFDPSVRDELKAAAFQVFADRQTFRDFPNPNVSKSGKVIHLESSGIPMFDSTGNLVGYRGADTDVTERRQIEMEAQRSRAEIAHLSRVAMLGELSGSLAHELNQPLTAILSNAQAAQRFLAEDNPDLGELRDILQDIVADDQRAGEVIRRLRLLLKKGEVQQVPLDVNEVVQDVLKMVRNELLNHDIGLRTDFADKLPVAKGDRVQLQQVLLNLIMNANEAMATTAPADRQLTVRTAAVSGHVRVSVADRGTGIAPDVLGQMFGSFFTTKTTGLGLGLPVSRTIISSHGGHLRGMNNPDRGATFEFDLPIDGNDNV